MVGNATWKPENNQVACRHQFSIFSMFYSSLPNNGGCPVLSKTLNHKSPYGST